ncbi:MAG: hypothetical protein F6K54_25420 [Okeania sp. SIO3B5]|uniref:hypothetical protein n=1 Tax=Okeania sp. SIO3B5 TaxID=2607811 RepID=UPI001400BC42|nr:hypothetical protein [Okeania sp. SIO3B5]NEO56121.1 hypothetical protein [Okeania sp. SIO3B5]
MVIAINVSSTGDDLSSLQMYFKQPNIASGKSFQLSVVSYQLSAPHGIGRQESTEVDFFPLKGEAIDLTFCSRARR